MAYELIDPDQVAFHCHTKVADPWFISWRLLLSGELETFGHDSKLYAASAATFLAIHLLKKYAIRKPKMKTNPGGLSPIQLRRATDYIYAHLAEGINLDTLSSHLGLSRYYFLPFVQHSTGFSPYQYVIRCRVERAKGATEAGRF